RSDVNSRSILFSDGKHIFVVDMTPENTPSATRAIRAYDGVSVKIPDFSQLFTKRERIIGGKLLLNETVADGSSSLRLYDIINGKDTWKESFPAGTLVIRSDEHPNFTGVVEPDGKVRVWRIPEGTQVLSTKLDPKFIVKGGAALLLADKSNFYVAFNNPVNANIMPWGGIQTNLMPGSGMRAQPVNGEFYAFERETGKIRWHNPVSHQMVVLESFQEIPMLLFTSRMHKMVANGPIRNVMQIVAAKSIDKRTGKLIYDNENIPNGIQFHNINLDLKNGKIEFVNYQLKIIFKFGSDAAGISFEDANKKNS
ncbi:MAG: outer membrane protein assembly factor BamB, partial [Planctomycetota bacterium]